MTGKLKAESGLLESQHLDETLTFRIFNRVAILGFGILILASAISGTESTLNFRLLTPVVVAILSVISSIRLCNSRKSGLFVLVESAISVLLVLLSLLQIDEVGKRYVDSWAGFGLIPTGAILISSFVVVWIWKQRPTQHVVVGLQDVIKSACTVFFLLYLPVFIQPSNGLLNFGDTTYHVLDEMLAPLTGKVPYFDYSPQYTAMFGWLLYPITWLGLSPQGQMTTVLFMCNVFIALIPLIASLIVRRLFPSASFRVIIFCFVSVWCVSGQWNGSSVQLKEFAVFGRNLPLVVAILALLVLLDEDGPRVQRTKAYGLGVVLGLVTLNNPDTGGTIALSILVALAIAAIRTPNFRQLIYRILLGISLSFTAYIGFGLFVTNQFSIDSFVGIRTAALGLYEPSPLYALGPHLIVVSIGASTLVSGLISLRSVLRRRESERIAIVQVALGLSICVLFIKFFARPITPSTPQFFVPVILAAMTLVLSSSFSMSPSRTKALVKFPLLLITLIPVGALLQVSNPIDEVRRITEDHLGETDWSTSPGRPVDGWTVDHLNLTYDELFLEVKRLFESLRLSEEEVMYFGYHGNTVELNTGIKNGIGIPSPESIRFGGNQVRLACAPISQNLPIAVIVYDTEFPCDGYQRYPVTGVKEIFRVFKRVN
jgi:hypothetical protein